MSEYRNEIGKRFPFPFYWFIEYWFYTSYLSIESLGEL